MPSIYKYDNCWFDASATSPAIQDGLMGMRNISYLILHFKAKAPVAGKPVDLRWVGTYGNGGVDPYGDRTCNMRDISGAIIHFEHKNSTLTP